MPFLQQSVMNDNQLNENIAKAMLTYSPCPVLKDVVKRPNLDSWEISLDSKALLLSDPNAILFGAIFDYQIPWEKAWEAPLKLKERLGHLDPFKLAKMTNSQLLPYLQRGNLGPALHRFPPTLAKRLIFASQKLVQIYKGSASNIWANGTAAKLVMGRLEEFEGISQKISNMMGRLLGTYFGVFLTKWEEIDVAVDRHVARVFLRTGMVQRSRDAKVPEVREEIILRARALRPSFPGCLDDPAFDIGINWCTADEAYCDWTDDPCPLAKYCPKKTWLNIR